MVALAFPVVYKNNSGKAKVTVTRTVALATLDAKPGETGQPK